MYIIVILHISSIVQYTHAYITDLVIAHSPPLFLAYGTSYRMNYGRSNPYMF